MAASVKKVVENPSNLTILRLKGIPGEINLKKIGLFINGQLGSTRHHKDKAQNVVSIQVSLIRYEMDSSGEVTSGKCGNRSSSVSLHSSTKIQLPTSPLLGEE